MNFGLMLCAIGRHKWVFFSESHHGIAHKCERCGRLTERRCY